MISAMLGNVMTAKKDTGLDLRQRNVYVELPQKMSAGCKKLNKHFRS